MKVGKQVKHWILPMRVSIMKIELKVAQLVGPKYSNFKPALGK